MFVTGTDTDVGKTFVAVALLRALAQQGKRAVGMKPIASGCTKNDGRVVCDDVEQLRTAGNVAVTAQDICPYAFGAPIAPHLAAASEGVTLDLQHIARRHEALAEMADWVVIEGAGGWRVPLGEHATMADLARTLGRPIILVVRMRLGCLNHALLSAEAIARDGVTLTGWVANVMDPKMSALTENIDTLRQRMPVPLLSIFGHDDPVDLAASRVIEAMNI